MIPFLIGLVCLLGAWRALAADDGSHPAGGQRRTRGVFAVGIIAVLVLLQLWTQRDAIARYRFSLVGLRYGLTDARGRAVDTPLRLSGNYDEADLHVPGAGHADVAQLRPIVDSTLSVVIDVLDDAGALLLVEEKLAAGRTRWRIPSAVPVGAGDTVIVRASGAVHRFGVRTVADTVAVAGVHIPIPWARRHVITLASSERLLPSSDVGFVRRLRGAQPSVFARTWPLADVITALDSSAVWALPPINSFFFIQDRRLFMADVDSEVEVIRPAGVPAAAVTPGLGGRTGRRVLVAALPHRDYPELRLTLPERYGIRPLRTMSMVIRGEHLDVMFATPEMRSLDRRGLEAIRLPPLAAGDDGYRIRVSHARNALVRQAVVFESPPRAFAAASQAIVALDASPRARRYDVVTPAGFASAQTGRPVPLGGRDRSILLRVDGQSTSFSFWLIHGVVFVLVAATFAYRRPSPATRALALIAAGFGGIRLLLGLAAMLEEPFVQEAHEISLWLLPFLPWAIIFASEYARDRKAIDFRGLTFHAPFAAALITLTLVVFAGSPARQLVLGSLPVMLLAAGVWRARPARPAGTHSPTPRREPRFIRGWCLGALLLGFRALLELAGWREGIMIGGTRLAVSVLHTPLTLIALALVLHHHDVRITSAAGTPRARVVFRALADVLAFVALAFAGVAFWISDFGILLVGVPGVLLMLALLGARWTRGLSYAATAAFALPLLLFLLLQSAPGLLHPVWRGASGAEGRMGEWNRNELLLLERGDPGALRHIGQRRSEALAVMRETMRSYTRGNWLGRGFLEGRVSNEIKDTSTREHTVGALLASQWGLAGTFGLVFLLLALIAPIARASVLPQTGDAQRMLRAGGATFGFLLLPAFALPTPFGAVFTALTCAGIIAAFALAFSSDTKRDETTPRDPQDVIRPLPANVLLASLALLTVTCSGLYMILANYGLAFFTGKNVYLLGLDSISDALEATILLAGAAAALAWREQPRDTTRAATPARAWRGTRRAFPRRGQPALTP